MQCCLERFGQHCASRLTLLADFLKGSKEKKLVYICHYGAPAVEQNKVSNAKGI